MIDITGIDKPTLLLTLWQNAKVMEDRGVFTLEMAQHHCAPHPKKSVNPATNKPFLFFSFVLGRKLMVNLDGGYITWDTQRIPLDVLDERTYDSFHGVGAAQKAVDEARAMQEKK